MPRHTVRRVIVGCALGAMVGLVGAMRVDAQTGRAPHAATAPQGWRLVWQDEFDGAAIDTTRWAFDLGRGFLAADGTTVVDGWGNNELQCYTRDTSNAAVRDGRLHIRAVPSSVASCPYTSARLKTRAPDGHALFAQRYGRFEFRAKLPVGQGLWPALWMLPLSDSYGTWAASGEIDVMEARGQTPSTVLGTLHYGARWPDNTHTGADYLLPRGGSIADFHTYAVEWEPGRIRWFVDGVQTQEQRFWWSTTPRDGAGAPRAADLNPWPAPFDRPFYLVMNLAVGGNFLGNPDATTPFPGVMEVDFVRVYQRRDRSTRPLSRGAGRFPWSRAPGR
jgi:beta-glucanase (GH16 family)